MVRAVRGDLNDLSAQAPYQRGIFAHRINHDDAVIGGEEHIDQLPLGGEALAAARRAEMLGIDFYKLPPDEQKILKRILSKSPNIKNSPFNFRRKRK